MGSRCGPILGLACLTLLVGCGARSGLSVDGGEADSGPPPVPETCDGRDDDGDGRVDEGIPPQRCGVGACAVEVPGCVAGAVPACRPRPPEDERCNGEDDDCDGAADEGLGLGEVADPIVVRDRELSTGECTSCRWAGGAQLFVRDDSMVAVWRLGFDGIRPMPNAFARRLGREGRPDGPIVTLFDTNVPNGFRLDSSSRGRAVLAFCGRIRRNDVMASAWIDVSPAAVVAPAARDPSGYSCGAHHPVGAWTGRRHLFAWTDNRGGDGGMSVLLDVAGEDGDSVEGRELHVGTGDLSASPDVAVGHDRAVVVAGIRPELRRSELAVHVLDLRGEPVRDPLLLDPPPVGDEETWWGYPRVVATAEGFVVMGTERAHRPGGRLVARLSPEGELVGTVERLEPGRRYSRWSVARRAGGAVVFGGAEFGEDDAGMYLAALDARGREVDLYRFGPEVTIGLSGFDVATRGSRIHVLYAAGPAEDREPNQVVLRTLGCVE